MNNHGARTWASAFAVALTLVGCASDAAPVVFERQSLFVGGQDGYPTYRIPSLIETPTGALLAFAEGRHAGLSDTGDIDIVLRRSLDGGRTWSPLSVVYDAGADTAGNPAPVIDRATGDVILPFCTNPAADINARHVWVMRSTDDGVSWSSPVEITADVKGPTISWFATGPGRSIQMQSGRFVVPCDELDTATGEQRSCVFYSDDGTTWQAGASLGPELDEAQVAELGDGSLLISMRDDSTRYQRAFARSYDGGATFGAVVYDPAIPDPGCEGSMLSTPYGLLHSNPASDEFHARNNLTVRLSTDDGATFGVAKLIEPGPSAYSSLAIASDGNLLCLFEVGEFLPYDRLDVVRFSRSWLDAP